MWHRLELSFETALGPILLILLGCLVLLCLAYIFISWRQRKQAVVKARNERYQNIKRDGT